ncbi:MAG: DNA repair photolyase [Candidatus Azotimanducaceae bacterium]|jgi:DNA repair photolyase
MMKKPPEAPLSADTAVSNSSPNSSLNSVKVPATTEVPGVLPTGRLIKGRGAASNPDLRFSSQKSRLVDDGWWQDENDSDPKTEVLVDRGRTIISTNNSPDISFDQSINPYRGCEHGCIYCYARPTHAYWDLSPGIDFETKIITKPNADLLLRQTLSKSSYQCKAISIGANTDPYQPLEAKLFTTRKLIQVLQEFRHPFSLITKSSSILRDLDLLAEMAELKLCSVAVSVTTLDNALKAKLEPRTASGESRLKTIKALSDAGIPVTLMVAPVIPFINDSEIETILQRGKAAGAVAANMIYLRLPHEVSPLFQEWLGLHYPDKAEHVMSLVRQGRKGKDYDSSFYTRMSGEGVFAESIRQRFNIAARKLALPVKHRFQLDTTQFRRGFDQLSLF